MTQSQVWIRWAMPYKATVATPCIYPAIDTEKLKQVIRDLTNSTQDENGFLWYRKSHVCSPKADRFENWFQVYFWDFVSYFTSCNSFYWKYYRLHESIGGYKFSRLSSQLHELSCSYSKSYITAFSASSSLNYYYLYEGDSELLKCWIIAKFWFELYSWCSQGAEPSQFLSKKYWINWKKQTAPIHHT